MAPRCGMGVDPRCSGAYDGLLSTVDMWEWYICVIIACSCSFVISSTTAWQLYDVPVYSTIVTANKPFYGRTGWPKNRHHFFVRLNFTNQFSKLFQCHNQEKICNNTIDHYRYHHTSSMSLTLPCEMSSVLKATTENKTSVTTHFK